MERITAEHINPIRKEAERENLVFCKNTEYFGIFVDEALVAFTGILWYRGKAVFKNHFVLPEHRRQGYFKSMFDDSVELVRQKGIKKIEANCTDKSIDFYVRRGAKIIRQYAICTKVRIDLQ